MKARDLTEFNVEPTDDTIVLDQKMTMLVEDVLADARQARQKADVVPAPTVNGMIAGAEGMYASTDRIYRDIGGMYKEIGSLQTTLDNNYKKFERDESASSDAYARFNAASDAMAGRVARMNRAVDGMAGKVTADARNLGGMQTALEHMGKDGEAALNTTTSCRAIWIPLPGNIKLSTAPCGNRTRWFILPPTRPVISKNKKIISGP